LAIPYYPKTGSWVPYSYLGFTFFCVFGLLS
jgi:hypothetical protein